MLPSKPKTEFCGGGSSKHSGLVCGNTDPEPFLCYHDKGRAWHHFQGKAAATSALWVYPVQRLKKVLYPEGTPIMEHKCVTRNLCMMTVGFVCVMLEHHLARDAAFQKDINAIWKA